jgi:hypothetical protein
MVDDPSRRAAADAVRRRARSGPGSAAANGRSVPVAPRTTTLAPTARQRAFVPLAWGAASLVVLLVLPLALVTVALGTAGIALGTWLLAGRSAVILGNAEFVVRRPIGRVVLRYADLRGVERRRPALTERAELVRGNGRRVALPAPQSGPLPALVDPAFDERLTLLRYRVARGMRP